MAARRGVGGSRRAVGPRPRAAGRASEALERAPPKRLEDVDASRLLGFDAALAPDHPGYGDAEYVARRSALAALAHAHVPGEPPARVLYTPEETRTWAAVHARLAGLFPEHACAEFNESFDALGLAPDAVPQLQDVDAQLRASTGWGVRPVAGLLHPREFLAGLSFRTFHSTQYVRHHSAPFYTPEPDVIHEVIGHIPMFVNPDFARMVHAIGQASIGATQEEVWHLTKVYWYSVEFGVVREAGAYKAFGAGILSSFGELEHMSAGNADIKPLDPWSKLPKMSYKDGYQQTYFALNSFEEGAEMLTRYADEIIKARGPPEALRGTRRGPR